MSAGRPRASVWGRPESIRPTYHAGVLDDEVVTLGRRLVGAFTVLVLVLVLVGCDSGVTIGPKLAKDQVLRLMLEDQPATLDPGQTQYSYETAVLRAISEPLLKPNAELTGVAPAAAQSYEANDAGTAYVFHLRSAAKYWDGTPVKAQDFVYAWQRLTDPRLAAYNETLFADAVLNGQRASLVDPQRDGAAIDGALGRPGPKAVAHLPFQWTLPQCDAGEPGGLPGEPAAAGWVAGTGRLGRGLCKTPDPAVLWLGFPGISPPLDNVRLRLAMAQAIDRDAYVSQVLAGQGLPATTFIPKGMHGYSPNLTSQKFDVAQARASLAASGLSAKQVSVTFSYDQSSDFRTKTAKFVHDQLVNNLGINVVLQALDPNTLSAHKDTGEFQVAGPDGWSADYPDQADWYDVFLTTSSYNFAFWQSEQYDNFVRVARTDTQAARRDQEYLQAQTMLVGDAPVTFLAQTVSWYLVEPYVRGVATSPVDEWPRAVPPRQPSIAPH